MKIPVKRFLDDPSLPWEERFRRLLTHHEEETRFLITRIDELEGKPLENPPTPEEMIAWFDQLATHTRSQPAKSIVLSPLDLQDLVRAAHQQPAGLLSAKDGTMVYRNNTTLYEAANQPPGTMRITYGATTLDVTAHSPLHLYREGLAWK